MNTNGMLSMVGAVSALVLAAAPARGADSRPMVATRLAGTVMIHQNLPLLCGGGRDVSGPLLDGGIEVTPAGGADAGAGNKVFTLARLSIRFQSFNPSVPCLAGRTLTNIGASLVRGVSFTGVPDGRGGFTFAIPKDAFVVYEAAALQDASGGPPEALMSFIRAAEDVIGSFEVGRGTWTMRLHVRLNTSIHAFDGDFGGSQTADIQGTLMFPDTDGDGIPDITDTCPFTPNVPGQVIPTPVITPPPPITLASCLDRRFGVATAVDVCFGRLVTITNDAPNPFSPGTFLVTWSADDGVDPVVTAQQTVTIVDTTPPRVSCVATRRPTGNAFRVSASDQCDTPVIRLGSFVLDNGEVVQIQETGQPGVRFIGDLGNHDVRHFLVGKGEAVITATDASRNVATAVCVK